MNSLGNFSNSGHPLQFISKAHSARRALQDASRFWLYLPAYLALLIALGAACRALAHFITNSDVTVYLWAMLIVNIAVSIGVQCGTPAITQWSVRGRILLFALLPVSAFLFNITIIVPMAAEAEFNATISLIVGWMALLCILLIGMRYGSNAAGEQRIPLAAPLVPALSLFGLLNSLSVDTIVQICFVIFVAAALYLIAYERMLSRVLKSNQILASEYSGLQPLRAKRNPFFKLSRPAIGRAAAGYFVACSLWFAAFIGGGALFYYPVEAYLPRIMASPLNVARSASASLLDWRGSSSTVELRGGDYPLSDREIMKVEVYRGQGAIPSLWRGRTYEIYSDSRWIEDPQIEVMPIRIRRGTMVEISEALRQTRSEKKPSADFGKLIHAISPRLVQFSTIEAFVESQRFSGSRLYFPGELTAIQGVTQLQATSAGTYTAASHYTAPPRLLRTTVKNAQLSALRSAPGLSLPDLQRWRGDATQAFSLRIDAGLKEQLAPIIAQIKQDALSTPRGRFDTPLSKAEAIGNYLLRTCTYSLSAPLVPSNQDAIVFFLTQSKTGACDMFASSMAMLLRAVDVPARLATGYIKPEEITESSNLPDALSFVVRERDAHAWVEYYVPGAGWLNTDPTAGTRTTELPVESQIAGILHLPNLHLDFKTLWLPTLGLLLIATGLLWTFFDFSSGKNKALLTAEEVERARVVEIYEQAVALLSRHVPRARHQTPLEYEAQVQSAPIAVPAKQEFSALTYLLMSARYRHAPPAMNHQELQACLTRLRQAL